MKHASKSKKPIIVSLIVFIAASAIGGSAFWKIDSSLVRSAEQAAERDQTRFADEVAEGIERYFADIQKRLETVAVASEVRQAKRGEPCNLYLQDIVQANSADFSNLGRINRDGFFACAVNRAIVGQPASTYGTYFATIANDPAHKAVMSPLIFPSGANSPVVAVHVPVYDGQNFNGTIGGAVYFDALEDRLSLEDAVPHADMSVVVYDTNGDILYHPDPLIQNRNIVSAEALRYYSPRSAMDSLALQVKQSTSQGITEYSYKGKRQQVIFRTASLIGRQWTVSVALPYETVLQTYRSKLHRVEVAGVIILVVLFATWLSWIGSCRLVKGSAKGAVK